MQGIILNVFIEVCCELNLPQNDFAIFTSLNPMNGVYQQYEEVIIRAVGPNKNRYRNIFGDNFLIIIFMPFNGVALNVDEFRTIMIERLSNSNDI